MFRVFLLLLAVVAMVDTADAAPRGRRARHYRSTPTSQSYAPSYATSSAQGVAELQAQNCAMNHHGGNSGYEGVGMGSTPEEALGRCCYSNSGMAVVDQGVAQGRDGRWYACKRYR